MAINPFDEAYGKKLKSKKAGAVVILTKTQKGQIDTSSDGVDLMELTRKIFKNPKLDGRSREGLAVRKYMTERNITYGTQIHGKMENLPELTEGEIEYIEAQASRGENALQIAKGIYGGSHKNIKIKSLSREHRLVMTYMEENLKELVNESDRIVSGPYKPPSTFKQMLSKVNFITKENFIEDKIDTRIKKCIEKSLSFAQTARFVTYANNLKNQQERDLFEAEFIGTIWNKPDLTRDELNLCYNLCQEYIKQFKIDKYISILEEKMEQLTEDNDGKMSMSIIENIKNHRKDHKDSVALQKQLTQMLNGSREKRIANQKEGGKSISQFVEFVRNEEDRMLVMKNDALRKKLLEETMEEYENTDKLIVNIYGVEKDDILEWEA